MAKKLSGWFRLFIIFAGLCTALSIGIFLPLFLSISPPLTQYEREKLIEEILELKHGKQNREEIEQDREEIERDREENEREYKRELRQYHKDRRNAIFLFLLYWLVPIGLVYGSGRCVGWIIRGFRKDKE